VTTQVQDLASMVESCWRAVREQIDGIDLATPVYPNPLWSARDVLIHCAFWNDESTRAIEAHRRGESYVTDTGAATFDEGLDAMNQRVIESSRSLSEDEVRRRWIAAQDRFAEAVRTLDDAALSREITCPWTQRKPVPEMVQDELDHETEHIHDVITAASSQEGPR